MSGTMIAALVAAFVVTVLILIITGWCYGQAFYVPERRKKLDPHTFFSNSNGEFCREPMGKLMDELLETPCEVVTIKSRDGLKLSGRFYRFSDNDSRVEILFHGWRSSGIRDASGGARIAREIGYNLLIVDQRAHGDSEGHTLTFGIKEKYDCIDWVRYVIARFGGDVKILLGGVSMGAATVLMASCLKELPPQVKAITADCGYTSPKAILCKSCRDRKIPPAIGYPFLRLAAQMFGGFSLKDGGAVEAVKHAKVPIMIMHGEGDDFVQFPMAQEIFDACQGEKQLLTIPEADHGLSYFFDTERYSKEVGDFKRRAFER